MTQSQRYQPVSHTDTSSYQIPNSPPPSFRSRESSPTGSTFPSHLTTTSSSRQQKRKGRSSSSRTTTTTGGYDYVEDNNEEEDEAAAERTMNDAFDSPSDDDDDSSSRGENDQFLEAREGLNKEENDDDDDDEDDETDADTRDRRRLIQPDLSTARGIDSRGNIITSSPTITTTHIPVFAAPSSRTTTTTTTRGGIFGGGTGNDGVFANLSAKPTSGNTENEDEKPPSYEQAAADATPPYWETTILTHPGFSSHEVYVDGLPVGSFFSFLWNAMISVSFTFVGFLLTYLLHTTHAAKNGSRAGLGITLVQYGFNFRGGSTDDILKPPSDSPGMDSIPSDPNTHDFDSPPTSFDSLPSGSSPIESLGSLSITDSFAYILMIIGWFILIRAVSDFYRARQHELLVLQSPDRGLGTAVVAEGEEPTRSV